jgi:polyhydroxyalkanoate synthase subunit PhaC
MEANKVGALSRTRAVNLVDRLSRRGIADLAPMPSSVIDSGPQRTVCRYESTTGRTDRPLPVLLVPPLGASAKCFDLRRGCSLAEFLLAGGYRTYLIDYGPIERRHRKLGLEHWTDEVLPAAVGVVARDAGDRPVQLVGWCLGGVLALLLAANEDSGVQSVAMIGSPFEANAMPFASWLGRVADVGEGAAVVRRASAVGGAPAFVVGQAYRLLGLDRQLAGPLTVLGHLGDREFLAQIEAVDAYAARMEGYPGRALGQVHHALFSRRGLATGELELDGCRIRLADVRVPVLSVAAARDRFAPPGAVYRVAQLLVNAPEVTMRIAPGGHLGSLTGRRARETTWRFLDAFLTRHGQDASSSRRSA